ncbi:hypothetical protein R5W24_006071 [Gemmata sp. JC717]|uniref:Carboxypeptidase regulatory-like domain-containing protein n=1 Tax=Gemmata algarum TaxID=2975278 RepID=A0ABU5F503_9BACT|nr:hypothetical protein [Gemmata algarum]MDY3556897.1 hypothetical protein [Gemmata algarum]MDY3562223.1 hypothetical protein [Gemmata algarum]
MKSSAAYLMLAVTGAFALVASGCSDMPAVGGKVQYEDKTPVKGGTVTFNSADKKISVTGVIADDGTFKLMTDGKSGAPAGSYTVVVVGKNDVYGAPPTVDEVYGSPLTTPLKQDVAAGANDITITVKRPANAPRR